MHNGSRIHAFSSDEQHKKHSERAHNARASSSPQTATPGTELLAKVLAPALGKDARRRGQRRRSSASRLERQAPLTLCPRPRGCAKASARASRGLPPHFSESRWLTGSSCSNRPGSRLGKRAGTAAEPPQIPRAAQPKTPRRAGPGSQNAPLPEAGAEAVFAVPRRSCQSHSPQLQLPHAGGVGRVAGWRMLLPTERRGRNGNRNRRRRLTEPSAPLTEAERKAARAGQLLTARDRERAGSRARDPK
ncbi:hypothetical protein H8959_016251 [Pygathrix nigripes]